MKTNTTTFSIKLEMLADELLNAPDQAARDLIVAKIETLKEYEQLLQSAHAPSAPKKIKAIKTGRKFYDHSDIVVKAQPLEIKFNYRQYVEGSTDRPSAIVTAIFHGFLKVGNQSETTLAIESCDDVLDLERCKIYGFQAKSLKDLVLV